MADSYPVRLHPRAEADTSAAYHWYLERNPLVAEIFLIELNSAMDHVARNPRRWPRMGDVYRRYLLGRFPYSVVYQVKPRHVEVLAVAHHRRRPGYCEFHAGRPLIPRHAGPAFHAMPG